MAQGSLFDLIDKHEGAGNYSTLFGHSQREGGHFAGIDPSSMTMAELDTFEKEYGPWVKEKLRSYMSNAECPACAGARLRPTGWCPRGGRTGRRDPNRSGSGVGRGPRPVPLQEQEHAVRWMAVEGKGRADDRGGIRGVDA